MVGGSSLTLADSMTETPKPLTVSDIHAAYAGKASPRPADEAKHFQSTKRFARDPAHPGEAPQAPERRKGKYSR